MNDEAIRQRNIDRIRALFQAEQQLDLQAWAAVWAENAVRRTPFAPPGFPVEQRGMAAIVQALRGPFEQALWLKVSEEIFPTTDPTLIIARAKTAGELRNGVAYENEVVAFFRFDGEGRIIEWTGYLNPLPIVELMKKAASIRPTSASDG